MDASEDPSVLSQASGLLAEGKLAEAGDLLHQAAADALALDDAPGAIRLLQLSAATARSAGSPEMGRARAEHAAQLAREFHSADPSLTVLALAEAAECALTLGDPLGAAAEFAEAAEVPDVPAVVRTALMRRRAGALADGGDAATAIAVLHGVVTSGEPAGEELAHIRLEMAGIAQRGMLHERDEYLRQAVVALAQSSDPELHADLQLMQSASAAEHGRLDDALDHACRARSFARDAEAPVAYIGATMSVVQFLEETAEGERTRLEVYATLSDGMRDLERFAGEEVARAAFAPAMEQRRSRWGAEAYAEVQAAIDHRDASR